MTELKHVHWVYAWVRCGGLVGDLRASENVMRGGKWTCKCEGEGKTMLARVDNKTHPQNTQHTFMYICTCGEHKEVTVAQKTPREEDIRHRYECRDRPYREGEQNRS